MTMNNLYAIIEDGDLIDIWSASSIEEAKSDNPGKTIIKIEFKTEKE